MLTKTAPFSTVRDRFDGYDLRSAIEEIRTYSFRELKQLAAVIGVETKGASKGLLLSRCATEVWRGWDKPEVEPLAECRLCERSCAESDMFGSFCPDCALVPISLN